MLQFLSLVAAVVVCIGVVFWRHDAKQRSRGGPVTDWWFGWRAPQFLLFDYAGGEWWGGMGVRLFLAWLGLALLYGALFG